MRYRKANLIPGKGWRRDRSKLNAAIGSLRSLLLVRQLIDVFVAAAAALPPRAVFTPGSVFSSAASALAKVVRAPAPVDPRRCAPTCDRSGRAGSRLDRLELLVASRQLVPRFPPSEVFRRRPACVRLQPHGVGIRKHSRKRTYNVPSAQRSRRHPLMLRQGAASIQRGGNHFWVASVPAPANQSFGSAARTCASGSPSSRRTILVPSTSATHL